MSGLATLGRQLCTREQLKRCFHTLGPRTIDEVAILPSRWTEVIMKAIHPLFTEPLFTPPRSHVGHEVSYSTAAILTTAVCKRPSPRPYPAQIFQPRRGLYSIRVLSSRVAKLRRRIYLRFPVLLAGYSHATSLASPQPHYTRLDRLLLIPVWGLC